MRKATKPLYERGEYRLVYDRKRDGSLRSPFIQIVWYDREAGRNRSRSTGTQCLEDAERQLDALYSENEKGRSICHACGQTILSAEPYLLTDAIAAYIAAREDRASISAIRPRLGHIFTYLIENGLQATRCDDVDEEWVGEFREWNIEVPVEIGNGNTRERSPGTVEASVRQLAAVINFAATKKHTVHGASFSPIKPRDVSHTPTYRAPIETLGAMFRYCTNPERQIGESEKAYAKKIKQRTELLHFLQISVSTWARPDAAHDVSTDPKRRQWDPLQRKLQLNPKGRTQTRKFRPIVPIARQMAPLLDATTGYFVNVASVRQAWEGMQSALGLPGDRESGLKLIRRSMAQLARNRMTRAEWIEGKIMLGHHRPDQSDLYGMDEPGDLPRALEVTEQIIDEIIMLAPLAFAKIDAEPEANSDSE